MRLRQSEKAAWQRQHLTRSSKGTQDFYKQNGGRALNTIKSPFIEHQKHKHAIGFTQIKKT